MITRDSDTGRVLEDREVSEIMGREKRLEFRNGPRNIVTTFTYNSLGDSQPHKWGCSHCNHVGLLKVPGACQARESIGALRPTQRQGRLVMHHQQGGRAYAWDDVSGTELDAELTLKARMEEMEQVKKHGVYEKVREDVCWSVTGKGPVGTRLMDISKGGERNPEYRSRLVAQHIKYNSKEKNIFAAAPPLEARKPFILDGSN